ncbi:MtrB/PioB family decaheme-associated outer membrane protein [Aestuariirhabdus litorea]|uniref:MtrB/PioB family decaheme-associated outer membrane protein n=1 Tax=Aestuariirhabdus litorea TaxID=2528527 RepID=A0A3P3VJT1_9GAMM|nr:MtrB/PioB family decaheme-associated outer membrane protein [Aestuariirhabdus litorea]RRJ82970.1 MtrB/PioB family decaheme-associated outer membrane protein [Aestuariirhabdus litorea]RWW93130.1 MtrB/PioB family decaheme-associated outer membrane protein [Endozoicomonadaceae bacterium GTF-13]
MNTYNGFKLLPLCAAVGVAISGMAWAEEEELKPYTEPDSSFSLGAGWVSDDNYYFSQYSRADDKGFYPLFGADINHRDDDTGTWMRLRANTGSLSFEHNRQGDWKYSIGVDTMRRNYPYNYNTTLKGSTKETQDVSGTGLRDKDYKVTRDNIRFGATKWIDENWSVNAKFRSEKKKGARPMGAGYFAAPPVFFTEPVDANTQEFDASVMFTGEKLQVQAGAYMLHFDNKKKAVYLMDGGVPYDLPGFGPPNVDDYVNALPLDSTSWQGYVNGGYNFTTTTRGDFRIAYAKTTQDDSFYMPTEVGNYGDLDGEVAETNVKLGIVSRPINKLTLRATYRYRDKDDETPERQYKGGSPADADDKYVQRDLTTHTLETEASYRLPMNWKLTGMAGYEKIKRPDDVTGNIDKYKETEENSFGARVNKRFLDNLSASLQYEYKDRDNSGLEKSSAQVDDFDPIYTAKRTRNEGKLLVDWSPVETLSTQFLLKAYNDDFDLRNQLGVDEIEGYLVSLDANYALNDDWELNGWVSTDQIKQKQYNGGYPRGLPNPTPADRQDFKAELKQKGVAFGVGAKGAITEDLKVGIEYNYQKDKNEYDQTNILNTTVEDFDSVEYKQQKVRLFGDYQIDQQSSLGLSYSYNKLKNDDWNYDGWVYDKGNTVDQDDNEIVHFIGASYRYSYQ